MVGLRLPSLLALVALAGPATAAPSAAAAVKNAREPLVVRATARFRSTAASLTSLVTRKPKAADISKKPPLPKVTKVEDTVAGRLRNPNFFQESTTDGTSAYAPAVTVEHMKTPSSLFFSGQLGRLYAARFINRGARTDGDFRYAYGERAFRGFMAADARLDEIAPGQLADHLSIELLKEVNRLAYVPGDDRLISRLALFIRRLNPRARTSPGELRNNNVVGRLAHATDADIATLKSHGLGFRAVPGTRKDARMGQILYADHHVLAAELDKLIDETKAALRDPAADAVKTAARFEQRFVALHPFPDGNGRVARLMMDHILMDRGLVPPILSDTTRDLTASEADYAKEVAAGVNRMARQLGSSYTAPGGVHASMGPLGYTGMLFSAARMSAPDLRGAAAGKILRVKGLPFAQGPDGFVYDFAGRPYRATGDHQLEPLSQMTYYLLMRRVTMASDPTATLTRATAPTRDLFEKLLGDPAAAASLRLPEDKRAITSDNHYRLDLPRAGNEELLALFDPAHADAARLFPTSGRSSSATAILSRYDQLDLELWHLEKGLARAGDRSGQKQVAGYRAQLFDLGKAALTKSAGEKPFLKQFEQVQYARSPLSRSSLAAYVKDHGDDTIALWRGDSPVALAMGVRPDNMLFRPDARGISKLRARSGGSGDLFRDLASLEGHANGSGFQSFTSDLGLLADSGGFADKTVSARIELAALPGPVRRLLDARLKDGAAIQLDSLGGAVRAALGRVTPKGHVSVRGADAAALESAVDAIWSLSADAKQKVKERIGSARKSGADLVRIDDVVPESEAAALENALARTHDLVTVRRRTDDPKAIDVTMHRRAFAFEVSKADALPGIEALGGSFEHEQEIHVLASVHPWRQNGYWSASELSAPIGVGPPKAN